MLTRFEWDSDKDAENQQKHGVSFSLAQQVFLDPKRIIGAGFWRKGKRIYEQENQVHR